jgi:hypothetical protein
MASIYQPINTEQYEIRLLHIEFTKNDGDAISATLVNASLLESPKYSALSYCWGDEDTTVEAFINGIRTPITFNLDTALRYFRRTRIKVIWADALCINQSDLTEKSLQVRFMKQIYHEAETTIAWLGDTQDDRAENSLRSLKCTGHNTVIPQACSCVLSTDGINDTLTSQITKGVCVGCTSPQFPQGLVDLFKRPYWRRRWVIQEIVVSSRVEVVCGQTAINIVSMENALQKCRTLDLLKWNTQDKASYTHYNTIKKLHESHSLGPISMVSALSATSNFLSRDPSDTIFAILGISLDGVDLVPLPSYHKSPEDISIAFSQSLIRKYGCFDIIWAHRKTQSRNPSLPSWAPDWLSGQCLARGGLTSQSSRLLPVQSRLESLQSGRETIVLRGALLGIVESLTTSPEDEHHRHSTTHNPTSHHTLRYYGTDHGVLFAMLACLVPIGTHRRLTHRRAWWLWPRKWMPRSAHNLSVGFQDYFGVSPPAAEETEDGNVLKMWLQTNSDFTVAGKPLQLWLEWSPWLFWVGTEAVNFTLRMAAIILTLGYVILTAVLSFYARGPFWCVFIFIPPWVYFFALASDVLKVWEGSRKDYLASLKAARAGKLWVSWRLGTTSTGMLATLPLNAQSGDKVCFLGGCTSVVVLREVPGTSSQQHRMVGQAHVSLNAEDATIFRGYAKVVDKSLYSSGPYHEKNVSSYHQAMQDYVLEPWWERFVIV